MTPNVVRGGVKMKSLIALLVAMTVFAGASAPAAELPKGAPASNLMVVPCHTCN